MAVAWIIVNLVLAVFGFPLAPGAPIGWEAHLAGYAAGLLLVGPAAWALGRLRIDSRA
jgi:membrane associated rhomboid family serine protease